MSEVAIKVAVRVRPFSRREMVSEFVNSQIFV